MRFYLISNNIDTYMGMRLAGIEGIVTEKLDVVLSSIKEACENKDIGILLITQKLAALCPDVVMELKRTRKRPLIVEIPDRHPEGRIGTLLEQYIGEAIGIKM